MANFRSAPRRYRIVDHLEALEPDPGYEAVLSLLLLELRITLPVLRQKLAHMGPLSPGTGFSTAEMVGILRVLNGFRTYHNRLEMEDLWVP